MLRSSDPPIVKAASLGVGLFWGLSPFWGFHTAGAVITAILFKLNKPITILASNISLPPLIPFIIYASYKIGGFWLGANAMHIAFNQLLTPDAIQQNLIQYVLGSLTLASAVSLSASGILFVIASAKRKES